MNESKLIDIHVHYFPQNLFQAIWKFFETKSHGLWTINYKLFGKDLVQTLKDIGVSRFTTLVYAHKKGVADYLNNYIFESSQEFSQLIPFGTIYAGDGDCANKAKTIFEDFNFYGIKMHPFVSNEQVDDKRFFPVYEIMESSNKVLICHPGSGPVFTQKDGAQRLQNVLKEFPNLKIVVAHCGAFEYGDYTALADDYEFVYFDTAMNCVHTPIFENNCPGPEFFKKYSDRILFGSDFPNIPYKYQEQIDAIKLRGLGLEVEKKIFEGNAKNLFML